MLSPTVSMTSTLPTAYPAGIRCARQQGTRAAAALLLTLVMIAAITLFTLAFLGLVRIESRSSDAFAKGIEIGVLADMPTDLVVAQIRKATESVGTTQTWASQPGMIRVYGNDGDDSSRGRANLREVYKLYSASEFVVNPFTSGIPFDPANEVPPDNWSSHPARFVDLNEPVITDTDLDGTPLLDYPIINGDLAAMAPDEIRGFEVDGIPKDNNNTNPIPMPVEWLYVLRDGTVTAPISGTGTKVKFTSSGQGAPSEENPIVARVAFWADDETSKVNINTATEGVYWDMPRSNSHYDAFNYNDKQPVNREYQRYPGHPATTSLSPVLHRWLGTDPETYYDLAPFIEQGGSMAGTTNVIDTTPPVTLDSDRLYSTVDEYIFNATDMDLDGFRRENHNQLSREVLDQTKFFLTAHSRAPETNLFNRPRVSLWPLQEDPGDRNATDQLLEFCARMRPSTGPQPYYFQRKSVHSLSNPQNGYSSALSPTADFAIRRNDDLYKYLEKLTELAVPGFSKRSFLTKYSNDRSQILTSMFDQVRSGVNTMAAGLPTANDSRGYFYVPPRQVAGISAMPGEGQVIPIHHPTNGTKGFGRAATITELALVIYPSTLETNPTEEAGKIDPVPPGYGGSTRPVYKATQARAFLIAELFTPSVGPPTWSPYMDVTIEGLNGFGFNFPSPATVRYTTPIGFFQGGATGAGHSCAELSPFMPFYQGATGAVRRDVESDDPETGFAWHSAPRGVPTSLPATTLKVTLSDPRNGEVFQTLHMQFPGGPIPRVYGWSNNARETQLSQRINLGINAYREWLIRPGDVTRSVGAHLGPPAYGDLRFYAARKEVPTNFFQPVRPATSDERLPHGIRNGNDWQYFGHLRGRTSTPHGLDAIGSGPNGDHPYSRYSSFDTGGSLIASVGSYTNPMGRPYRSYRDAHSVGVEGLTEALRRGGGTTRPGDWDQGFGNNEDGPYINKPDETNSTGSYWNWGGFHHSGGYFRRGQFDVDQDASSHSPNRQICSGVAFGSLPSGIWDDRPWETLLFCPNPAGRFTAAGSEPSATDHFGFTFPRDHLLLDLFWMPVVEPYAISEPFSTAGKVNMNYDIMPFRYIKRRTALHAVLDDIQMMAVPPVALDRHLGCYKGGRDQAFQLETRYDIRADEEGGTLQAFEERFYDEGDLFRSASEICEVFLVPKEIAGTGVRYPDVPTYRKIPNPSYDDMISWWQDFTATGDNARETPYNQIYPRLTTKSNTYRVHHRVQRIRQLPGEDDQAGAPDLRPRAGQHRGRVPRLHPRRALPRSPGRRPPRLRRSGHHGSPRGRHRTTLDRHYQFRVIRKKRFAP